MTTAVGHDGDDRKPPGSADRGLLVVLAGPSGVGKGTVARRLLGVDPRLRLSVSVTTRRPRVDEIDGVHYHFVDDAVFDDLAARGELLEWAAVHRHRSGTPRRWVEEQRSAGHDVLLEIDVQGALTVRQRVADALLVFLAPPSQQELARRLVGRGTETADELAVRHADAARELATAEHFDVVVVNDELDRCVAEVHGAIAARRAGRGA